MDYRCITNETSNQYKLLKSGDIRICSNGLLKDSNNNTCIAIGQAYASVGDVLDVTLESGIYRFRVLDLKATKDTKNNKQCIYDGSFIEFVVDADKLPNDIKLLGNLDKWFRGNIKKVEKVND